MIHVLFLALALTMPMILPRWGSEPQKVCVQYLKKNKKIGTRVVLLKSERVLCYFKKGKLVFRAGVSYGKAAGKKRFQGDHKTPEGDYGLAPARKSAKYSLFMLIDYPRKADRLYAKKHGKPPGSAVGIHGPPQWAVPLGEAATWFNMTRGCVILSMRKLKELAGLIKDKTPLRIHPVDY